MRDLSSNVSRITCWQLEIIVLNHWFYGKAAGRKRFVVKIQLPGKVGGVKTAETSEGVLEGRIQTDFWKLNRRASERSVVVETFPEIKVPFPGFLGIIE
jgi:hypothetical protein